MRAVHPLDHTVLATGIGRQPGVVVGDLVVRAHRVAGAEARGAGGRSRGGRAAGQNGGHVGGRQQALDRHRRMQQAPGGHFVGQQLAAVGHQLRQRGQPQAVVAQARIAGLGLAGGAALVDVPRTGGAHRQRQRHGAGFEGLVPQRAFRLGLHGAEARLAAQVGMALVAHGDGAFAKPVPIIESRVTRSASAVSPRPALPTGRCGITR